MRTRAAVCVLLLMLSLSSCREEPERRTAPASPTTDLAVSTSPAPRKSVPERGPVLAGPGTVCGEIQPPNGGPMAAVAILEGRADCRAAVRTFRSYYRADTPKQGSAGVATVGGWRCASNSAAQANTTGRLSSCRKAAATIVADVIP
ncbi:hypothetical protein ACWENQ_44505 [Nonomuraea sp. NPDC004354]